MATILIVDDHETNRQLLTTLLGYWNHQVVAAGDGMEGLERARSERPDLIITDVLMPAMDGYEFTRRLREDPALAATLLLGAVLDAGRALSGSPVRGGIRGFEAGRAGGAASHRECGAGFEHFGPSPVL